MALEFRRWKHFDFQNPAHTYTSPDNYTVYLTATNAGGSGVSASQIITVIQPKPVTSFTENTTSGTSSLNCPVHRYFNEYANPMELDIQ